MLLMVHPCREAKAFALLMSAMMEPTPSRAASMAIRAPLMLVRARSREARLQMVVACIVVTASPCERTDHTAVSPLS